MKYAVLDFETTGSQAHDRIIQAGLVLIENYRICDVFGSLVYSDQPIPADIVQLTGIRDEDLQGAPELQTVMERMAGMLDGAVLVAHNASFDAAFLQRALQQTGLPRFTGRVLDSIELTRICFPSLVGLNLGMLAKQFGVVHDRPHQADSDAHATAEIWLLCLERLRSLPLLVVQRIEEVMARQPNADIAWFFQQMRAERERATAIDPDANRYMRRLSFAVGNWGERAGKEESIADERESADFAVFYEQFKARLKQLFAQYEERTAQEQMIAAVYDALSSERHLMVEAGTGTGKSLAYLIPALFYSLIHDETLVVSTHTINLMEQLIVRDIPLLQQLWPESFRAAIVKGRNHYLCLRKFEQTVNGGEYATNGDMFVAAAQMLVWLNETQTGDVEELQFWQKGRDMWKLVESDSQTCLNRACPWYKKCFYHRSRHEANQANLIITNHSMLFSDLQTEHNLLPAYRHVVVDEAHHFEAAAGKHFGIEVSFAGFLSALFRLYRDARNGQLPLFKSRVKPYAELAELPAFVDRMSELCLQAKECWEQLNDAMYLLLEHNGERNDAESEQYVYRLRAGQPPYGWDKLRLPAYNLTMYCTDILKNFEKLVNRIKNSEYESELQGAVVDLAGAIQPLQRLRDALQFFFELSNPEYVYWLEASARTQHKSLHYYAVPIEVRGMLKDAFFDQKSTVIMTSATLTVDQSFRHATDQLGLAEAHAAGRVQTLALQSPFRYEQQALVCIPRDFPSVKGSGDPLFIQTLVQSLHDVAEVTNGRMLVLFTSNRMLRTVYYKLQPACQLSGMHVLAQNITSGSRSKLTKMFCDQQRTILLGTSSFWEGVDIPGAALSCLAIVRLPFQPPNHPLFEAKSEHLKRHNRNSFMELAVPQAVIKFKQGFGRLIRTATDRGIVIVYDHRVISTKYGAHFLRSLPNPRIEQPETAGLSERIHEWLQELHHA